MAKASTPMRSSGLSTSTADSAATLAMSSLMPPSTFSPMLAERSSTTTTASEGTSTSVRTSTVTGRARSTGVS